MDDFSQDLIEEDFNNFIYYQTKERMNFITSLKRLFDYQNYIGLCGPFGTGKTITLLKFVINSQLDRIFYINLWTIENTSLEELKILFKYESIKLLGEGNYGKAILVRSLKDNVIIFFIHIN